MAGVHEFGALSLIPPWVFGCRSGLSLLLYHPDHTRSKGLGTPLHPFPLHLLGTERKKPNPRFKCGGYKGPLGNPRGEYFRS